MKKRELYIIVYDSLLAASARSKRLCGPLVILAESAQNHLNTAKYELWS
jgi:hypothetical protein